MPASVALCFLTTGIMCPGSLSSHCRAFPSMVDHTPSNREPSPSLLKLLLLGFPQQVHSKWALRALVLWDFPPEWGEF